jgi:hypothetical protein
MFTSESFRELEAREQLKSDAPPFSAIRGEGQGRTCGEAISPKPGSKQPALWRKRMWAISLSNVRT